MAVILINYCTGSATSKRIKFAADAQKSRTEAPNRPSSLLADCVAGNDRITGAQAGPSSITRWTECRGADHPSSTASSHADRETPKLANVDVDGSWRKCPGTETLAPMSYRSDRVHYIRSGFCVEVPLFQFTRCSWLYRTPDSRLFVYSVQSSRGSEPNFYEVALAPIDPLSLTASDWPDRDVPRRLIFVVYRVAVTWDGKVKDCAIKRSSGVPDLDARTCQLLKVRGRFQPSLRGSTARIIDGYLNWAAHSSHRVSLWLVGRPKRTCPGLEVGDRIVCKSKRSLFQRCQI